MDNYFSIFAIDLSTEEEPKRPNTAIAYVHEFTTNHAIPADLEADIINAIEKIVNDYHNSIQKSTPTP